MNRIDVWGTGIMQPVRPSDKMTAVAAARFRSRMRFEDGILSMQMVNGIAPQLNFQNVEKRNALMKTKRARRHTTPGAFEFRFVADLSG